MTSPRFHGLDEEEGVEMSPTSVDTKVLAAVAHPEKKVCPLASSFEYFLFLFCLDVRLCDMVQPVLLSLASTFPLFRQLFMWFFIRPLSLLIRTTVQPGSVHTTTTLGGSGAL